MSNLQNPFAFKAYEERLKSENAPNYITPQKRLRIREYLSKSSIGHVTR